MFNFNNGLNGNELKLNSLGNSDIKLNLNSLSNVEKAEEDVSIMKDSSEEVDNYGDETSFSTASTATEETTEKDADLSSLLDANGDGKITAQELDDYNNKDVTSDLDANGDGKITQEEIDNYYNTQGATPSGTTETVPDETEGEVGPADITGTNIRRNQLSEAQLKVYEQFEKALKEDTADGDITRHRFEVLDFMNSLDDCGLKNFIEAYNYMNEQNGGFAEMMFQIATGKTSKDFFAGNNSVSYLTSEGLTSRDQFILDRISNMLSDEDKDAMVRSIYGARVEDPNLNSDGSFWYDNAANGTKPNAQGYDAFRAFLDGEIPNQILDFNFTGHSPDIHKDFF